ncbi:MAG: thiolase family protein [Microbacterium arborescens]
MPEVLIVAARRTPLTTRGRGLAGLGVDRLAAPVLRAAADDAAAVLGAPLDVADVVLGNCRGPGGNPARVAALAAEWGFGVTGSTVDRQCGSGLAAIIDAWHAIAAGDPRPRLAGGVESASTAPVRSVGGVAYERAPFAPAGVADPDMLDAADALAAHDGIDRERQDAAARRSHDRAARARDAGRFDDEIVAVAGVRRDDGIGAGARVLERLQPVRAGGTVTAGTATRIGDGAAAVALVDRAAHPDAAGLLVRGAAVVGCDPALPGIGAAPAIEAALADAGIALADVTAFEIVEAFAAQSLAVLGRLGIADDDPRVCADGGALALGHPWGASGAVAVVRLFSRLVRGGAPAGSVGVAAASVGGGMGVALVVEVVR